MLFAKNRFIRSIFKIFKCKKGISSIEFAIVFPVLFAFVLGIIEVGGIFFGYNDLYSATQTAARLIRTGQAQQTNMTQQQMIAQICSNTIILVNCTSNLRLNVQSFPAFASITAPNMLDGNGNLATTFPYNSGSASQIILVTSAYEWSLLGVPFGNLADGNFLLQASIVIQNEPFA